MSVHWKGSLGKLPTQASLPARDRAVSPRQQISILMRNIFVRLRREHFDVTSKKITAWNPGSVMYKFNLDELLAGK